MGESFAYFCWFRLHWPNLARLFPNAMRDGAFDDWRLVQRIATLRQPTSSEPTTDR